MAVYTSLSRAFVESMLSVYPGVAAVVELEGIAEGSINTTYRVKTADGRELFLRVNEGKELQDVVHERDLLEALGLRQLGVVTPRMLRTVPGGVFFPVDLNGPRRWACVFPRLPGREIAAFEVTPAACFQVGAFLARAHGALRTFHGHRPNPFRIAVVRRWVEQLRNQKDPGIREVADELAVSLTIVEGSRRLLPRGVVHGDLFIDNTRWQNGRLAAVFDWEMAGTDHLLYDVAVCLNAWGWQRGASGEGVFLPERCRELMQGYQSVRPLKPSERRGLFIEVLLAGIRFTTSRLRDFEVPRPENDDGSERRYLDYRDFLARVRTVRAMRTHGVQRLVGLRP